GRAFASFRRGRRRRTARLDQRARARPLSDAVESLRPLRPGAAGSARLPAPPLVRVLGARRVSGADVDAAVVAPRDARLPRTPHGLVGLAATPQPHAAARAGGHRPGP